MFETGKQIGHTSEETVGNDFKFEKGEVGIIRNASFQLGTLFNETTIKNAPSEQELANAFINSIKQQGGNVAYLKAEKRETVIVGRETDHYTVCLDVFECHFVADPFVVDDIILLAVITAIFIGGVIWVTRPVWLKAGGVSTSDLLGYNIADIPWLYPILIVVVVYIVYVMAKGRRRK